MSVREKRDWLIAALIIYFSLLIELAGASVVVPIVVYVVDPQSLTDSNYLAGIRNLFGGRPLNELGIHLAGFGVVFILVGLFASLLGIWVKQRYSRRLNASLSAKVLSGFLASDLDAYVYKSESAFARDIMLSVDKLVYKGIIAQLNAVSRLAFLFTVLMLLWYVDPLVTAVTLLIMSLSYFVVFLGIRTVVKKNAERNIADEQTVFEYVITAYRSKKQIIVDGYRTLFVEKYFQSKKSVTRRVANLDVIAATPKNVIEAICLLVLVVVALNSAGTGGAIMAGKLTLFGLCGYKLLPSLQIVYSAFTEIIATKSAYEKLRPALTNTTSFRTGGDSIPIGKNASIVIKNVSYRHPAAKNYIYKNFNLKIPLGKLIVVEGASGSGKSTLIELILRLRQAESGVIYLSENETFIRELYISDFSYLPQQYYLYGKSAAECIFPNDFSKEVGYDRKLLTELLEVTCLDRVLKSKNIGVEDFIGSNAELLSGGERARLAIACSLAKNRSVLILDEALAALDAKSIREIVTNLHVYRPNLSLIVILHAEFDFIGTGFDVAHIDVMVGR